MAAPVVWLGELVDVCLDQMQCLAASEGVQPVSGFVGRPQGATPPTGLPSLQVRSDEAYRRSVELAQRGNIAAGRSGP
ncbi:hypothetical protein JNW88_26780 [Micromonospora sp. ATA32]|nr:hypothetical protein [Micromonospora sp. ATA32]